MKLFVRLKSGTVLHVLIVLVFALLCVIAILQPQRWLFLFSKTLASFVVLFVLFVLYGLARNLK